MFVNWVVFDMCESVWMCAMVHGKCLSGVQASEHGSIIDIFVVAMVRLPIIGIVDQCSCGVPAVRMDQ